MADHLDDTDDEVSFAGTEESLVKEDLVEPNDPLIRLLPIILPCLLLALIALMIGVYQMWGKRSAASSSPPALNPAELNPAEVNPLITLNHSLPLPFGAKAIASCISDCATTAIEKSHCERGCERLSVAEYARTPRTKDLDPIQTATLLIQDCTQIAEQRITSQPKESWTKDVAHGSWLLSQHPMVVPSYEVNALVESAALWRDLEPRVIRPEQGSEAELELANRVQAAVCGRQVLVAVQLAVAQVGQTSDILSEQFYRRLESSLAAQSHEKELELTALQAVVFEAPPEAKK